MNISDLRDGNVYYKDILNKYGFTHLIVPKVESLSTYMQKILIMM